MKLLTSKVRLLNLRVTQSQDERYAMAAEREGFSRSEWFRRLAERRLRELEAGLGKPGDLPPAA
jgi:hypothetical protein